MGKSRPTPIIIGVGDIVNRSKQVADAIEPLQLMLTAIEHALADTGLDAAQQAALSAQIDSIDVVKSWTWPCDYPTLLAERLACHPVHQHYSDHGGNQPAKLLDEAARRISLGEARLAVVTGGEALASLSACAAADRLPPPGWTTPSEDVNAVFSPTTRQLSKDLGAAHSIGAPIHIYPLYENGFRAHRNQSVAENHAESAKLYADFAQVAARNPLAWSYPAPAESQDAIATVSKRNRMICFPYPLLMNAFNTVNLAAACILTSVEFARELGIPPQKWIYPLGGAGTAESNDFWQRSTFWWSPSISRSLDAAIEVSALEKGDIDIYDFYSCFPIVPKLACHHMGLSITQPEKPITLLGGLTSFGGAGNNYSMHAMTEMVRRLRRGQAKTGLVLANGGWITYQHVVCLSRSPRPDGLPYPDSNPLPPYVSDVHVPRVVETASGDATIETYTVEFRRDGTPLRGHIVGRLRASGARFLANHADPAALEALCSTTVEPIGRAVRVRSDADGRNLFSLSRASKI